MKRDEVREALCSVLREIQLISGRAESNLTDETRPIGDLPEFTSANGVEAAALLSARLGFEVKPRQILAKHDGQHPTIGQLLDRLCPDDGA